MSFSRARIFNSRSFRAQAEVDETLIQSLPPPLARACLPPPPRNYAPICELLGFLSGTRKKRARKTRLGLGYFHPRSNQSRPSGSPFHSISSLTIYFSDLSDSISTTFRGPGAKTHPRDNPSPRISHLPPSRAGDFGSRKAARVIRAPALSQRERDRGTTR